MSILTTIDGREWCRKCCHPWPEHDGMGDCTHPDGRTRTGFCKCGDR